MVDKRKLAVLAAEFFGTFVLAMVVLAMVTKVSLAFFPAVAAGLVLMVMVLAIGPISGAHINPAVTVALWSQRKIQTAEALSYILVQIAAGVVAWSAAQWLMDSSLDAAVTAEIDWRILTAEALGAFVFLVGVAAAIGQKLEGTKQAFAIGFSLTLGILVASLGSGGILNPAVAIALHSHSLSYVAGPLVGGVLGMAFYNSVLAVPSKKKR